MTQFQTIYVFPTIPEPLLFLDKLSRNLWWSWQRDAVELFRRIDPRLWRESNGNPLYFSTLISQERLSGTFSGRKLSGPPGPRQGAV